ncbi:MAG: hypothetical protein Q8P50_17055 [Bacillota bacterium]|nr:hypothetical protein [Bacillota bacterium]
MEKINKALRELGLPERDRYDLPSSPLAFPDGANYRIEIAGVERASTFEAMLEEASRRKVPVHRVIATVGGATYLDWAELCDFAKMAKQSRVEVIITLGPRRAWDSGRQITTREGLVSGMRARGSDNIQFLLRDLDRCLRAGFRGFLAPDEGMMKLYDDLRAKGAIPPETVFKVSVFAGHGSAAGARLVQSIGANSFNPLADLTLPMLASIRAAITIPMDVYIILVNAMGGFNRFYEAGEMARICSPCYFKFEPGPSEDEIYAPWNTEDFHRHLVKEKVRYAAIVMELIDTYGPEVRVSLPGTADLAVPRPGEYS